MGRRVLVCRRQDNPVSRPEGYTWVFAHLRSILQWLHLEYTDSPALNTTQAA